MTEFEIHYSGHGLPDSNPLEAGALACADKELHCWEILQAVSNTCPQIKTLNFTLDCCGAGGAFHTTIANVGKWPNIKQIFFLAAVDYNEGALSHPDGGSYFTRSFVERVPRPGHVDERMLLEKESFKQGPGPFTYGRNTDCEIIQWVANHEASLRDVEYVKLTPNR